MLEGMRSHCGTRVQDLGGEGNVLEEVQGLIPLAESDVSSWSSGGSSEKSERVELQNQNTEGRHGRAETIGGRRMDSRKRLRKEAWGPRVGTGNQPIRVEVGHAICSTEQ
ncbi:hypothetical protein R1flu_024978 [Riccia fluitans]|uniref:Uncharacterized protein n=1 Tax=Riccia fluitans TaxID=41844 RepID=A0ABD1XZI0_9MARC